MDTHGHGDQLFKNPPKALEVIVNECADFPQLRRKRPCSAISMHLHVQSCELGGKENQCISRSVTQKITNL
jgi:hypothetical protein